MFNEHYSTDLTKLGPLPCVWECMHDTHTHTERETIHTSMNHASVSVALFSERMAKWWNALQLEGPVQTLFIRLTMTRWREPATTSRWLMTNQCPHRLSLLTPFVVTSVLATLRIYQSHSDNLHSRDWDGRSGPPISDGEAEYQSQVSPP